MKKRAGVAVVAAASQAFDDLESPVPHFAESGPPPWAFCARPRAWTCALACCLCVVGIASLPTSGQGTSATISAEAPPTDEQGQIPEGTKLLQERPSGLAVSELPPISDQRAEEINGLLQDKSLDEVLRWVSAALPGQAVQFSSFGPAGLVILDRLSSLGLFGKIPTVMIDTLHLFPETYALVQNIHKRYPSLNLQIFYPHGFAKGQKEAFDEKYGVRLWADDFSRYTYLTKVEPTARALDDFKVQAWITGRRRSQGGDRKDLAVAEWDNGRLKVNPLANWTLTQVWDYLRSHEVPYNSLHDRGYASVGDVMTTRPLVRGEAERAGRFDSTNRTECGMHAHSKMIEAMREEAREHGMPFKIPTLPCKLCLEVRPGNFWEQVLETRRDMLIEFYSPFCGHCHAMAPKYEEIAKRLQDVAPQIMVARMDIISYDLPLVGRDAGFELAAYPTIFLVRPGKAGKPRVLRYEGAKEVQPLLDWLKSQLPELPRGV